MSNRINIRKIGAILAYRSNRKQYGLRRASKIIGVSRRTLKVYLARIENLPENIKANAQEVYKSVFPVKPNNPRRQMLETLFDGIHLRLLSGESNLKIEWLIYRDTNKQGYGYTQFAYQYSIWRKENGIARLPNRKHTLKISKDQTKELTQWRRSTDRRNWERAVAVLEFQEGKSYNQIAAMTDRNPDTVKAWIKAYRNHGLDGLLRKSRKSNELILLQMERKKANIIKLLHETPALNGINRTSWDLKSLSRRYSELHQEYISKTTISDYLKKEGYSFRKAKETLTSPDPNFREKLNRIKDILANLQPDEKFFSVDEFGPFSVRMKGGRSLVRNGERKTFPQFQKSKGWLICTAALELSENQVTHFYSLKKNTKEMIRLLELLLKKYSAEKRIFFSWDAASWHASKELNRKIDELNSDEYRATHGTPKVELAPLPASAQFLNVIESVFSGMARAIIHNSNYASVDQCKEAIDRYFEERNRHYIQHPQRAGRKIWGKERVSPVFSESHNCKDPKWR